MCKLQCEDVKIRATLLNAKDAFGMINPDSVTHDLLKNVVLDFKLTFVLHYATSRSKFQPFTLIAQYHLSAIST